MYLMFLLIFAGFANVYANHYTLLSTAEMGSITLQQQQSISVSGKVTDNQTGEAMLGVTVVVKGTTIGVLTDASGKYKLSVNDKNATLVFSFIGYGTQEIQIVGKTTVDVVLISELKGLDEVVVVGYGTQSRYAVTGSIASVDMAKVASLPNTNVVQALTGIPGVQFSNTGRPGQTGTILIRGQNSLSGSNDPLVVLDGIAFSGSFSDINPNDIESMEVLKDASSAAIYGSRAANGVILITSKRGTTEKPTISFNTFYGLSYVGNELKLLSPERYIERRLQWRTINNMPADPAQIATYLAPDEATTYNSGLSKNAFDMIAQQGSISSYDLSISGKTGLTTYYISGALANERGLIYNDQEKRTTVRANIDNQITKWLDIGITSSFSHRDPSGQEPSMQDAYRVSPFGIWYYPDGTPTRYPVSDETAGANPLYAVYYNTNSEIYDNVFANFFAQVDIPFIKGLSYRLNYSPNYRWSHNYNFTRQDPRRTDNMTSGSKVNTNNYDWVLENIVTYKRNIGENHTIDLTLLYGRNHSESDLTTASGSQFSTDVLGYNNLGLASVFTNSSSASKTEGISSMARLNYQFMKRYLLTLTVRRDASSVFAANNKYATFPSASLGWVISDEPFMKSAARFVDNLKLRVSYGAVGNQAISPYQSLSSSALQRYVFGDGGVSSLGVITSTLGNNDLKWESTYTSNAALDFSLFKQRISGTFEVYNSNTKNLLVARTIPVMTGYASILTNIGEVNNRGIELTLNWVDIKRNKFQWNSSVTFAYNRNEIVHLFRTDLNGDGKEDDNVANSWFIGYPIHSFYDYAFNGIYQVGDADIPTGSTPGFVRVKDINGDGKLNALDRTIVGSGTNPKYDWSFRNTFSYGHISLDIFVNGMEGWIGEFNLINPLVPGRALNQVDEGWWTADNKSNTRPTLLYNNPLGTIWYVSRDFVRIKDVSINYDFDKTILNKLKLSSLRFYLSVTNAYTFTKYPGSDPESGGDYTSEQGSTSLFPMPRTFTLGFHVGF
jgi:TonB-linked SusC/RagA family outer membrane protein